MISDNLSGVTCCLASLQALSGLQCDSIINPSYSKLNACCAISKIFSLFPQICDGSHKIGISGIKFIKSNAICHCGLFLYLFFLRSEEHTSELQSRGHLVCRLLLEKKQ